MEVKQAGHTPILWELEKFDSFQEASAKEKHWIQHCKAGGEPILNRAQPRVRKPHQKPGRKHTSSQVEAMLDNYLRTGSRPDGWSRQALHAILKKHGLR